MLKIGADPELFCFDMKYKKFVSAHPFFPGTKSEPFAVENGALQLDGLAAELNINPVSNADDFVKMLTSVMHTAQKFLPAGVVLHATPSAIFNEEDYALIPEGNKALGCTPDFNAWKNGEQNEVPIIPIKSLRAAGGHIHLGWTDNASDDDIEHQMRQVEIVKQLDCLVGLQCMLWDPPNMRKELYGKAGAYRPKSYGVEYRTPSNYWLSSTEKMKRIFELTKKAYDDFEDHKLYRFIFDDINFENIINSDDKDSAEGAMRAVLAVG